MEKRHQLLVPLLTLSVFSILNTEMGITGILPHIARQYHVSLATAGLLVSGFALVVALAGPTMPLLFSKVNRKRVMVLATGLFTTSTVLSIFVTDFRLLLLLRLIPAVLHPVYVSLAMTVATQSVKPEESQKAVAKVFMGVSAGYLLGVPVSNFLANQLSLAAAMAFFAVINLIVFIGTIFLVPSLPVTSPLTYGHQLGILKRKSLWISLFAVLLLNGAVYGFNAYLSDFLDSIAGFGVGAISLMLLGVGGANILGNAFAGQALEKRPHRLLYSLPLLIMVDYLILFVLGGQVAVVFLLVLFFGTLAGINGNVNQFMIFEVGGDAPDFANGLFLSSANLGVTVGTSFAGGFITLEGSTAFSLVSGLLLLVASFLIVIWRQSLLAKA